MRKTINIFRIEQKNMTFIMLIFWDGFCLGF